jgi:hypothetical protein
MKALILRIKPIILEEAKRQVQDMVVAHEMASHEAVTEVFDKLVEKLANQITEAAMGRLQIKKKILDKKMTKS